MTFTKGPRGPLTREHRSAISAALRGRPRKDVKARFLSWVEGRANGCWAWVGKRNDLGYGLMSFRTEGRHKTKRAHRVAFELFKGPIPRGLVVDHLCRHPWCVNPNHLEAVTTAENLLRTMASRAGLMSFIPAAPTTLFMEG